MLSLLLLLLLATWVILFLAGVSSRRWRSDLSKPAERHSEAGRGPRRRWRWLLPLLLAAAPAATLPVLLRAVVLQPDATLPCMVRFHSGHCPAGPDSTSATADATAAMRRDQAAAPRRLAARSVPAAFSTSGCCCCCACGERRGGGPAARKNLCRRRPCIYTHNQINARAPRSA
jgi:hypothetical protein